MTDALIFGVDATLLLHIVKRAQIKAHSFGNRAHFGNQVVVALRAARKQPKPRVVDARAGAASAGEFFRRLATGDDGPLVLAWSLSTCCDDPVGPASTGKPLQEARANTQLSGVSRRPIPARASTDAAQVLQSLVRVVLNSRAKNE